jgi:hypothetical protein
MGLDGVALRLGGGLERFGVFWRWFGILRDFGDDAGHDSFGVAGELVVAGAGADPAATGEPARQARQHLEQWVRRDEAGRLKVGASLPDESALETMAAFMARVLAVR